VIGWWGRERAIKFWGGERASVGVREGHGERNGEGEIERGETKGEGNGERGEGEREVGEVETSGHSVLASTQCRTP